MKKLATNWTARLARPMSQPILATARLHGPMASGAPVAPVAQGAQVPLTPWCLVAAEGTVVTGTLLDYDFFDFPETVGNHPIPTDFNSDSYFSEG